MSALTTSTTRSMPASRNPPGRRRTSFIETTARKTNSAVLIAAPIQSTPGGSDGMRCTVAYPTRQQTETGRRRTINALNHILEPPEWGREQGNLVSFQCAGTTMGAGAPKTSELFCQYFFHSTL